MRGFVPLRSRYCYCLGETPMIILLATEYCFQQIGQIIEVGHVLLEPVRTR